MGRPTTGHEAGFEAAGTYMELLPLPGLYRNAALLLVEHLVRNGVDSANLSILAVEQQGNLLETRALGLRS